MKWGFEMIKLREHFCMQMLDLLKKLYPISPQMRKDFGSINLFLRANEIMERSAYCVEGQIIKPIILVNSKREIQKYNLTINLMT